MADEEDFGARIAALEAELRFVRSARPSPYMTPAEAADYLRLLDADGRPDVKKIYTLRTRYKLRARRVGGLLRFHVADLNDFAADVAGGPLRLVAGRGSR